MPVGIECAASGVALSTPARLRDLLIGRAHGRTVCRIRTRPLAARRAGHMHDGVHPLDQHVKRVVQLYLMALDLPDPIAGEPKRHQAFVYGAHCTTPRSLISSSSSMMSSLNLSP